MSSNPSSFFQFFQSPNHVLETDDKKPCKPHGRLSSDILGMPTPQKYTSIMHFYIKEMHAVKARKVHLPVFLCAGCPAITDRTSDDNCRKSIENSREADDLLSDTRTSVRNTAYQPVCMIVLFSLRAVKKKSVPNCLFRFLFSVKCFCFPPFSAACAAVSFFRLSRILPIKWRWIPPVPGRGF